MRTGNSEGVGLDPCRHVRARGFLDFERWGHHVGDCDKRIPRGGVI